MMHDVTLTIGQVIGVAIGMFLLFLASEYAKDWLYGKRKRGTCVACRHWHAGGGDYGWAPNWGQCQHGDQPTVGDTRRDMACANCEVGPPSESVLYRHRAYEKSGWPAEPTGPLHERGKA